MKIFQVALGILAAIGGFVDIGDLVFNVSAGATFGYQLLWVILIGVVGIIVYSEMCGRVAAVSGKAVFDAVRERLGFKVGLVALISAQVVNLMTLTAEIGGVAICLQLLSGLSYRWMILVAVRGVRDRGLGDAVRMDRAHLRLRRSVHARVRCRGREARPGWGAVGHGFVPHIAAEQPLLYAYFADRLARRRDDTVRGLLLLLRRRRGAAGAPKDLGLNRVNAIDRLRARRLPLVRADDRRRRALSRQRASSRSSSARSRSASKRRSARSGCSSRSSASSSRSAAPRSTRSSPAPTTWRSSSGGSGAATAIHAARLASR